MEGREVLGREVKILKNSFGKILGNKYLIASVSL